MALQPSLDAERAISAETFTRILCRLLRPTADDDGQVDLLRHILGAEPRIVHHAPNTVTVLTLAAARMGLGLGAGSKKKKKKRKELGGRQDTEHRVSSARRCLPRTGNWSW